MKHANISIFIPHIGCPHRCSFCDQRTISGTQRAPSANDVRSICEKALCEVKSPENTEIAFFGGSFTAIPRGYMTELLETAREFIGTGKFRGIRISTRPDCIDSEILGILKKTALRRSSWARSPCAMTFLKRMNAVIRRRTLLMPAL